MNADILISGAGPTGLAAALFCAGAGYSVVLAAPKGTHVESDARTTALMMPGIEMLRELGVWEALSAKAAPLAHLRIVDATDRLIRAPVVTFHASEIDQDAFGYNLVNRDLNAALEAKARANTNIVLVDAKVTEIDYGADAVSASLSNGEKIEAKLVIGADGLHSTARESASISSKNWAYPQTALVTAFNHSRGHGDTSTEFHTVDGPFTQVPLSGNRSSLVWVMKPHRAEEMAALSSDALAAHIETMLGSHLGKVSHVEKAQLWPLSSMVAKEFGAQRLMLIGHAAHAFPPIGAQGLNLGFRDVDAMRKCLANAAAGDPGVDAVTHPYNRQRKADVLTRTGTVDALNRSLLSDFLPVQMIRAGGLSILRQVAPLRQLFMREGMSPGTGLSSLFSTPLQKIRERDRRA